MRRWEILAVGHITVDLIRKGRTATEAPGGPPTYAVLGALSLGRKAIAVSKIGRDFPTNFRRKLMHHGFSFGLVKTTENLTTRFLIEEKGDERALRLQALCSPIKASDLPDKMDTTLIASVAGEVSETVARETARRCEVAALDPQGFLREFGAEGRVKLKRPSILRILREIQIFKASLAELRCLTATFGPREAMVKVARKGPPLVITTFGSRGALMLVGKAFYTIPAYRTGRNFESTGAGDAFMGGFLSEYSKSRDPLWSAALGSSVASYAVQATGPWGLTRMDNVWERANAVYDGIWRS